MGSIDMALLSHWLIYEFQACYWFGGWRNLEASHVRGGKVGGPREAVMLFVGATVNKMSSLNYSAGSSRSFSFLVSYIYSLLWTIVLCVFRGCHVVGCRYDQFVIIFQGFSLYFEILLYHYYTRLCTGAYNPNFFFFMLQSSIAATGCLVFHVAESRCWYSIKLCQG